eukprot:GHVS01097124.1.p1 GENE.GHVS01097124.1~~GHVS01097124.1.p1  ORF type:complete len:325 (-),score=54.40 GHVS01097124.1:111-1085(-)
MMASFDVSGGFCQPPQCPYGLSGLSGKVAIVTGGAGAIGAVCAHRLAVIEHCNVAVVDIVDCENLVADLRQLIEQTKGTGTVRGYVCDVRDEKKVKETVEAIQHDMEDSIWCLFNNAGYQGKFCELLEYPTEDFEKAWQVNVMGVFNFMKAVGNVMKLSHNQHISSVSSSSSNGVSSLSSGSSTASLQFPTSASSGGVIINNASCAGTVGVPNMVAYSCCKAAVQNMTKTAAKELAQYNIRVCSVSPGYIDSGPMWLQQVRGQASRGNGWYANEPEKVAMDMVQSTTMKRRGKMEEVIGVVCFLLGRDASFLTGIDIAIAGGTF